MSSPRLLSMVVACSSALCGVPTIDPQEGTRLVIVEGGDASVSARVLEDVRRRAEAAVRELVPVFDGLQPTVFSVVVHREASSVPEPVRAHIHEGTAGVALLRDHQVHLVLDAMRARPPDDLDTVIEHEVAHVLLDQMAGGAGPFLPRWFHEGLAQDLSGSIYLGGSEEDIVWRARTGNLLTFTELSGSFPRGGSALRVAYAQSFSFVAFLKRELGLQALLRAARRCSADRTFDVALWEETGRRLIYLEYDWVQYLSRGSGAALRLILGSCFGLAIVAALPLLALAGARRWNRDHAVGERLAEDESPPLPGDREQP